MRCNKIENLVKKISTSESGLLYVIALFAKSYSGRPILIIIIIIIIRIIYLLNKPIKKKCSNMNSRARQQGKALTKTKKQFEGAP